ncbi:sulfate adenylyltransferase, large subunit [Anaeromyxobacter sp. K]|uniref:sulfate adenylyltransferase subunit 1 n=1 Tax=Anaeromyxobacter sp. (strain K) TaxID=447217 RepID=UPI00015F8330|nr:GTP-binding protein [Anaeromyxobacter sp. K]ACG73338.1 sulfate adenylyltransferase, large subunit [Anaeromyxobacter sp. K]
MSTATAAAAGPANVPSPAPAAALREEGLLRFLTCGSVDDGKSTLIGRLLHDTRSILADALSAIERTSRRRGLEAVDLSLLTDGLQAEREQGITIDVAYRYFSTGARKYIIADAPGHEQYTRNMVTAASTAHLALVLVDARKGVVTQTRRHAVIAHLVGIRHLVFVVNKLDLVGWSEEVFARIEADARAFAARLGIPDVRFVPISALHGDMVVERGANLGWYRGPTLLEVLERAPAAHDAPGERFRFPVQWVCRPHTREHHDFRGFAGRVESGAVAVGDAVQVLPSGRTTRVKGIRVGDERLASARAEQSVMLTLEDEVDVSRGDLLVHAGEGPEPTRTVDALVCWLSERPLSPARRYLVRHTTRETRAQVSEIAWRLDLSALERVPADGLAMNDIGRVTLRLAHPVAPDRYADARATGAFVVIDEATNDTVGAGMIQ